VVCVLPACGLCAENCRRRRRVGLIRTHQRKKKQGGFTLNPGLDCPPLFDPFGGLGLTVNPNVPPFHHRELSAAAAASGQQLTSRVHERLVDLFRDAVAERSASHLLMKVAYKAIDSPCECERRTHRFPRCMSASDWWIYFRRRVGAIGLASADEGS